MNKDNPWLALWTRPRETYRKNLKSTPTSILLTLAIVFGVINGISWIAYFLTRFPHHEGYKKPLFLIILLVVGAIYGVLNLYIGSWLYKLTGKWIGGKGNFNEVKAAVGLSFYPFIIAAIFAVLSYFSESYPFTGLIFGVLNLVFIVWGIVILLNLLGEAHQFSNWKALWSVIIAFILIFLLFVIIALLTPLLQPLFKN